MVALVGDARVRQAEIIRGLKQSTLVSVAELAQRLATSEVTIRRGPRALEHPNGPSPIAGGHFEDAWRGEIITSIAGGANEILLDIIAQCHLGLPRNRP